MPTNATSPNTKDNFTTIFIKSGDALLIAISLGCDLKAILSFLTVIKSIMQLAKEVPNVGIENVNTLA